MEKATEYFTATIENPSSKLDGEVTILVDEDGEMVLDITHTLSSIEQSEEGSVVIITTDQLDALSNSVVAYNVLAEESIRTAVASFHGENTGPVKNSLLPSYPDLQSVAKDTLSNLMPENKVPTFPATSKNPETSNSISFLTPVTITDGATVFVMESPPGTSSQIITAVSNTDNRESGGCLKVRRILPKPSSNKSNTIDPDLAFTRSKRRKGFRNIAQALNYDVCLLNQDSILTTGDGPTAVKLFICEKCPPSAGPVKFRRFEDLSRHYCKEHHLRLLRQASVFCREEGCSFKSWRVSHLRQHLKSAHGIPVESQTHEFVSMEEFLAWKSSEEKYSGSKFNRSSGDHSVSRRSGNKSLVYMYYACHRSGTQRIRVSEGSKRKKCRIESVKINGTCTASISLIHDKETNKISCDYCPTHYGHNNENPLRQNLSKQEKGWILQLLLRGWISDEIVKTLRNGTINGTTIRMRRVTRQDVFNVCRSHGGTSFERRDPDDNRSVKLWVEELRSKSSVLVWNNLDDSVLLLVVMNENQTVLAGLYGRIVYVSDTPLAWERFHRLITLCALSSTDGNAYLLAYAITDQSGAEALQAVFAAIQAKLGSFQPEFILAQDSTTVADAWVSGVEGFPVFLTPSWKVEKEWNENLIKYITNDMKRDAVKKGLDILLAESDPSKFSAFLKLFSAMLSCDPSLLAFSRFFATNYAEQAEHWARFHPIPDTSSLKELNAEVELIARRSRALKRLDKCIYCLEFIAANQPYQPITEFRTSPGKKESEELVNLRQAISDQMKHLERVVEQCESLNALKTINEVIKRALE